MANGTLNSKLVICNIPTTNSEAARKFYGTLLGSDAFAPAPNDADSYFQPISPDGIDLTITRRYDDNESWTCYFAVDSLDRAIEELSGLGGKIVHEPATVAGAKGEREVGRFAVMLDPDQNHVGLMEVQDEEAQSYFGLGGERALRPEQQKAIKQTGA